ncbi:Inositol-tetrakisphosphate 1-kinase 6 [Chlorella vulgaris]
MVGYVMKQSRQLDLSRQGMLPLLAGPLPAAPDGLAETVEPALANSSADGGIPFLSFFPIDLSSSLQHQLPRCHLVLQKLTDFLQPSSSGSGAVAPFSPEAVGLLAALEQQQQQQQQKEQKEQKEQQQIKAWEAAGAVQLHMVDSAVSLQPVMDRALLAQHLQATALTMRRQGIPMRAPASLLLHDCNAADTLRLLAAAGVGMPCILKPQAACGVAEAHQMAFVLHGSGLDGLEVPLPAVAQEYVDHGGCLWKVYAAGHRVFWTQRPSTPNLGQLAAQLAANPDADIPASIGFDSLRSLPTKLPEQRRAAQTQAGGGVGEGAASGCSTGSSTSGVAGEARGQHLMQQGTFEAVAAALRQRLGLTLFGFDLVLDHGAGELVIVDVNYFPSFKGIPEAPAALQAALRERWAASLAAPGGV